MNINKIREQPNRVSSKTPHRQAPSKPSGTFNYRVSPHKTIGAFFNNCQDKINNEIGPNINVKAIQ